MHNEHQHQENLDAFPCLQALFSSSGVKVKAVEAELSQVKYLLIEIEAEAKNAAETLRAVSPDFVRLKAASSHGLVGIIVTTCTGAPFALSLCRT